MSLALAHKRRVIADGPVTAGAGAKPAAYSAETAMSSPANARKHLRLMEDALAVDLDRISSINSHELRRLLKREELLPKYQEYVQRYRESGLSFPNPVLMYVLIWLFDTAEFDRAFELADFAMSQAQVLPAPFKRDIPTFVADELIDWAEIEYKAGRIPEPYVSNLLPRVDGEWKLFEKIPARYHKLLGILAMDQKNWAKAIEHFNRAMDLDDKIGVLTRLNGCIGALNKLAAAAAANESTD